MLLSKEHTLAISNHNLAMRYGRGLGSFLHVSILSNGILGFDKEVRASQKILCFDQVIGVIVAFQFNEFCIYLIRDGFIVAITKFHWHGRFDCGHYYIPLAWTFRFFPFGAINPNWDISLSRF